MRSDGTDHEYSLTQTLPVYMCRSRYEADLTVSVVSFISSSVDRYDQQNH